MRTTCVALVALLSASIPMFGQSEDVHHHNFSAGLGPAIPSGSSRNYLGTAPMFALRYGYRFNQFLQADAGLQLAWGAANNQNPVLTDLGTVQGGDHEYMFPLGGRVIIPTPFQRIEVSAGGGGVYLHYSETAPSNPYYQVSCYNCTSRGGWGGYGLANVSYFLDSNKTFRLGTTFQYISASTNGQAVGNVAALHTSDHWANLTFEFGISF
ncbi:MAG: hypothetical protein IT165_03090 [Bryobacterales bacterium]|nr:hypothetical protein [Bryobacterales bacterium]